MMNRLNYYFLKRTVAALAIATITLMGASIAAQADYIPPGGEPPTGRTSTSGMSL